MNNAHPVLMAIRAERNTTSASVVQNVSVVAKAESLGIWGVEKRNSIK